MTAFKNISDRLTKLANEVITDRDNHLLSLGFDAVALISQRVQRKGVKSTGQKFKTPYSRRPLKGYYFPEKFVKYAQKNAIPLSYENYRKFLGLPIDKRNLTLTGKMFASIKPALTKTTLEQGEVTIAAGDSENQKLVDVNSAREKVNILALSEKEREFLAGRTKKWITGLQNKYT